MAQGLQFRQQAMLRAGAQRTAVLPRIGRTLTIRAQQSGKIWGAEEENAAQVRRLINRDRKELNTTGDMLEKFKIEYGDVPSTSSDKGPSIGANTPNPFAASTSSNPFGSPSGAASPFGSSPAASSPFKSSIEPVGLRPDMSPDPIVKETPVGFLKSITLTQVVLFCSFSLIIGLMIATFNVVLSTGAIRLAGIE